VSAPVPPPDTPTASPGSPIFRRLAAALHYRDFRVLWLGAVTSSIGTWMQEVALSWLILTISGTASAFFLGLNTFFSQAPILLLTLIGGAIADRHDRRQVMLYSQYTQMGVAFVLMVLVYFDLVTIWHVLVLAVVGGTAQAFGGPAYQSLLPMLVEKEHVPNAIALNSIQFNLARVIGPLLAGATLATWGMVACFGLNGLSFLAVIFAILSMHTRHIPVTSRTRLHEELTMGLQYVRGQPTIVALTVLAAATTFLGSPLLTFLPLFARDVFHGGVGEYTQLMAFAGAGAVIGALVVAWLGRFRHMGRTLLIIQLAFGLLIVTFSLTRFFWINAIILFGCGAGLVMTFAMLNSLVQLIVPNEMRGRVVGIYLVAFRGGMPLGGLVSGWVATLTSATTVLTVNGVLLSLVAGWFLFKSHGVREL